MLRRAGFVLLVLLLMGGSVWLVRARRRRERPALPAAVMRQEPRVMLWAWESPQDFSSLDPGRGGVAFLAREVLLDREVTVRARRQPMQVADGTWLMAVVRVEAGPSFVPSGDVARRTAVAIAEAAQLPKVRAVQVDFDAADSERTFYAEMLGDLREALPAGYPVSITALVSWCGEGSWLKRLPVDEAVPMFFRMGGPAATRATAPRSQSGIAEPRCSGAMGLSTDEVWPAVRADQRVYLFHPGSWSKDDLARVNGIGYDSLRGDISP